METARRPRFASHERRLIPPPRASCARGACSRSHPGVDGRCGVVARRPYPGRRRCRRARSPGARGTPTYELPDALVTPGFVDGHTHFAMWALGRRRVQLAGVAHAGRGGASGGRRLAGAGMGPGAGLGRQWLGPRRRTARRSMRCSRAGLSRLARRARRLGQQRGPRGRRDRTGHAGSVRRAHRARRRRRADRPAARARGRADAPAPSRAAADACSTRRCARRRPRPTGWASPASTTSRAMRALAAFERLAASDALRLRVLFHPPVTSLRCAGAARDPERRRLRRGSGSAASSCSSTAASAAAPPGCSSRTRAAAIAACPSPSEDEAAARRCAPPRPRGSPSTVHAIGDAAVRRALDLMAPLPPRRRSRTGSSTSSASTRPTSTGPRPPGSWSRCSRRTC